MGRLLPAAVPTAILLVIGVMDMRAMARQPSPSNEDREIDGAEH